MLDAPIPECIIAAQGAGNNLRRNQMIRVQTTVRCTFVFIFVLVATILFAGARSNLVVPATNLTVNPSIPDAYSTIQAAIDAAGTNVGTVITVAPGTYFEHLDLQGKPITLQSAAGPEQTILDGSSTGAVITCRTFETSTTQIRGFTIQLGQSDRGGGISLVGSSPTIVSNIFRENDAGFASGAAIEGIDASPLIINNTFQNNNGYYLRGAVTFVDASSPVIANNLFFDNPCVAIALYMPAENRRVVVNNTLVGNSAGIHIAAYSQDAGDVLANNLLAYNGSQLEVAFHYGESVLPGWKNNLVYPRQLYIGLVDQTGINGNISAPPAFVCAQHFNYRLLTNSPGIDVGAMVDELPQNDFDNNRRVLMGGTGNVLSKTNSGPVAIVDIGAFEFDPAQPANLCVGLICPKDITVVALSGETNVFVDYSPATASEGATVICDPPPGSAFPIGTNVVTCTATLDTNIESGTFNIVVLDPTLAIQPISRTADAGSDVTFNAILGKDDAFVTEWQFNGQPFYYGVTSALELHNVQAADEGSYSATVLRADGSYVTRGPAYLHVKPAKPTITLASDSKRLRAGDNAVFYFAATGSAPIIFYWYHDGRLIQPRPNSHPPLPGLTYNWLQLFDVQSTVAGRYTVIASNAYGSASTNFTITVRDRAPVFNLVPSPMQTVLTGNNVTLFSDANGTERMWFQWQLNGHIIPGATNRVLNLHHITSSFAGKYTIVVFNRVGSVSASCKLKVLVPPKLLPLSPNTLAITGHDVTLRSRLINGGDHRVFYEWYRNERPFIGRFDTTPGGVFSMDGRTLTISNVTSVDEAVYRLYAEHLVQLHPITDATTATHLIVAQVPSRVYAWGDNSAGQATPPENLTNAIAVAAGGSHSLALRADGTVVAWGSNADGQCTVPAGLRNVVAIAAGRSHSLALRKDGTMVAWGNNEFGQCNVPTNLPKTFIAIAAGDHHNVALTIDHQLAAWGDNSHGQCNVYSYSSMIAAGGDHSLIWSDAHVLYGWGTDGHGEIDIPSIFNQGISTPNGSHSLPPLAIAAGKFHSVAISNGAFDGGPTAICWGDNTYGQCTPPEELTDVVQIGAGDEHTIALTVDGTIYCWGDNTYGQLNPPTLPRPATAIAAGANHNLALIVP